LKLGTVIVLGSLSKSIDFELSAKPAYLQTVAEPTMKSLYHC